MNRFMTIGICVLLIGCTQNITSPRIQFNEKVHNFGDIGDTEQVTHIFKFKNIGGDTLIIKDVRAP